MHRSIAILWFASYLLHGAAYPLKVAPGGRYLIDQQNTPFLMVGDATHNLFTMYTTSEAELYLRNRASNGVNTLWVEAFTGSYTFATADGSNMNGDKPFTNTLAGGVFDLTSPKIAYWAHCSNIVTMCATNGLQVLLDTLETGQYTGTAEDNGTNRCFQYGQFLGNWFKNFSNVMWITGNDYQNWQVEQSDECIRFISIGVRTVDPTRLQTLQLDYPASISYDSSAWRSLIDINGVYSYYIAYDECLKAWNTNSMPVLYLEGNYDGESNLGGAGGTTNNLRRQEYWSMLSGSIGGHLYGNYYSWMPRADWQTHMNLPSLTQLIYWHRFFTNLPWHTLVPDQTHRLVSAGYGTPASGAVMNESNTLAVAAMNGTTLGVVYTPTNHTLTIQMTNFSGSVTSRWFDPSDNTFTAINGSPFTNTISTNLTTPGNNAAGQGDWVLLLESDDPPDPGFYVSTTANVGTVTKQESGGGGGGGPDRWYYSNPATNSANEQYWGGEWFLGNAIICTNAGTITKIAARMEVITGPHDAKLSLWWNNGGTWTQADCNTLSCGSYASNWFELTLTSPKAIGNNETVRVFVTTATVSDMGLFYNGASGGFYDARSYANGCSGSALSTSDDIQADVAVYVD